MKEESELVSCKLKAMVARKSNLEKELKDSKSEFE